MKTCFYYIVIILVIGTADKINKGRKWVLKSKLKWEKYSVKY